MASTTPKDSNNYNTTRVSSRHPHLHRLTRQLFWLSSRWWHCCAGISHGIPWVPVRWNVAYAIIGVTISPVVRNGCCVLVGVRRCPPPPRQPGKVTAEWVVITPTPTPTSASAPAKPTHSVWHLAHLLPVICCLLRLRPFSIHSQKLDPFNLTEGCSLANISQHYFWVSYFGARNSIYPVIEENRRKRCSSP